MSIRQTDWHPNDPFWYRRLSRDAGYVRSFVDQLYRAEEKSAPQLKPREPDDDLDKEFHARVAIGVAGELVNALAGWAINHMIGRISRGVDYCPRPPWTHKDHAFYARARALANDPLNEIAGIRFECGDTSRDRAAAAAVLDHLAGQHPLFGQLADALLALDFGEVHPILRPKRKGRKGKAYTLAYERLRALEFGAFRRGLGMSKAAALNEVADTYGVDAETLHTWERRVREDLGEMRFRDSLNRARAAGISVADWKSENGTKQEPSRNSVEGYFLALYGDDAMQVRAKKMRAIQISES